jgi:hypothetical protein
MPVWKKFKTEVNLDDITNSPVQFYQFHKNNLWKLFRSQLLSNDHIPEKTKRSKSSIAKFMKSDLMALQLAFELTRIWLLDGNIMNQFLQDLEQRKEFNTAMPSIHNQVIRDNDRHNFEQLQRLADSTEIPEEFQGGENDEFLNS